MIMRIWHGWADPVRAEDYQRLVDGEVVPGILDRGLPGIDSVEVLRRRDRPDGLVEFATVMRFSDWTAVEAFTGGTRSYVPAAARALLHHFDAHAAHYDLVGRHRANG